MKWFWPKLDLQGKFRLLTAVGLVIWLSNFFIAYSGISDINEATVSLERCEDLYDSILWLLAFLFIEINITDWNEDARRKPPTTVSV